MARITSYNVCYTKLLRLVSSVVFGQSATKEMQLRKDLPAYEKKQSIDYSSLIKSAVWTNDFSTASDWTVGHASGAEAKDWALCTYSTAPSGWLPIFGLASL